MPPRAWSSDPVKVVVTVTEFQSTTFPLAFLPTVSGTIVNDPTSVPAAAAGIGVGVVLLTVTDFRPFFFPVFPSATLPDTRPTVTLSTRARTPSSARWERLFFIRDLPPSRESRAHPPQSLGRLAGAILLPQAR